MPVNERSALIVFLPAKRQQTWDPHRAATWAIARNWRSDNSDPAPFNIATSDTPNGWRVEPIFNTSPPEAVVTYPVAADTSAQYSVFVVGESEDEMGNGFFVLPAPPLKSSVVEISGEELVVSLPPGVTTEITAIHPETIFHLCEYPRCVAPVGVRISVLACGTNGDSTNGQQFVLLIENIDCPNTRGASTPPDITIRWTRCGIVQ